MRRVLAIGDIHGCLAQLDALLGAVAPTPEDRLIFLGDYVDRGPDSAGVLRRLIELVRSRPKGGTQCIQGNHEEMMMAARMGIEQEREWLMNGGREALASYGTGGAGRGGFRDVPAEHWEFLERGLVDYVETKTHLFVHGSVYPDMEMAEQPDFMLRWERFDEVSAHQSGKVIVCGHTPQRSGEPCNRGFAICIDTHVFGKMGWLTCLDVVSGNVWQANRHGEIRQSHISDFSEDD